MRVVQIATTAGNADASSGRNSTITSDAKISSVLENSRINQIYNSFNSVSNGNFETNTTQRLSEFLNSAFQSSATPATTPYFQCMQKEPPESLEHQNEVIDVTNDICIDLQSIDASNSYTSFKEIYNLNKSLYEDCTKECGNCDDSFENIKDHDSDLDPIQVINFRDCKEEEHSERRKTYETLQEKPLRNSFTEHNEYSLNAVYHKSLGGKLEYQTHIDREKDPQDQDEEYDDEEMDDLYNGELMTRFSEGSPNDDSLMEDEAGYITSPVSSCTSLSTPQRSHFPRGIINPNYPGFQHLAHTLSEHFLSHQSSDPYDSDISDYEMELSADSFDDFPIQSQDSDTNNTKIKNNNISNNIMNNNMVDNNNCVEIDKLMKSCLLMNGSDKLDSTTSEDNSNLQELCEISILCNVNSSQSDTNQNTNCNKLENLVETPGLLNDMDSNLQTYIKLFDITASAEQESEDLQRKSNVDIEVENVEKVHVAYDRLNEGNCGCPTPDILIKNYCTNERQLCKPENRPDLLRNVSPNPLLSRISVDGFQNEAETDGDTKIFQNKKQNLINILLPETIYMDSKHQDLSKEDISLGMTPIDIIGDFGQEVEREFGLLVSGYNSRLKCTPSRQQYLTIGEHKAGSEKMTDAVLSNGREPITTSKFAEALNQLNAEAESRQMAEYKEFFRESFSVVPTLSDQFVKNNKAADASNSEEILKHSGDRIVVDWSTLVSPRSEKPTEQFLSVEKNIRNNRTITEALSDQCEEKCHGPNSQSNNTQGEERNLVPTAIIRPKYQKASYDERQLPPVGIDFAHGEIPRAWFDTKESNNSVRPPRKFQNYDKNSKIYKTKFSRNFSASSAARGHSQSRRNVISTTTSIDTNSKNSENKICTVAIVNPRQKKDSEIDKSAHHHHQSSGVKKPMSTTKYKEVASWAEKLKKSENSSINNESADVSAASNSVGCFDVYNIETALPVIDFQAIESHLKKAKEEEKARRNDREEIRRRLAMGAEDDYFANLVQNNSNRPGRKPSLQSRLQNGKNLHICFMNDSSSDTESHSSDSETCPKLSKITPRYNGDNLDSRIFPSTNAPDHPYNANPLSVSCTNNNLRTSLPEEPSSMHLMAPTSLKQPLRQTDDDNECDFFTKQARLQIEARMALAQAKDMAHMQMEIDRQKQRISPITGVIRNSLEKVGIHMRPEKRRVSRQMLTDMNIAQLQVIVNDLHTQIEDLNDSLVHYLMERDDLHMGQDSMLVDIEDLTRYLSAKEQSSHDEMQATICNNK